MTDDDAFLQAIQEEPDSDDVVELSEIQSQGHQVRHECI